MKLLTFKHGVKNIHFIFGPYRERVPGTYGVRLTEDHQLGTPCDLHFPIEDFGVPDRREFEDLLIAIIQAADNGKVVYVGCMGGIGRTGMVVGGIARTLLTVDDAVTWARSNYLGHTIETRAQEGLVRTFDVNRVRAATFRGAMEAHTPPTNRVPPIKRLQLAALFAKFTGMFGNARRQADDNSRKS